MTKKDINTSLFGIKHLFLMALLILFLFFVVKFCMVSFSSEMPFSFFSKTIAYLSIIEYANFIDGIYYGVVGLFVIFNLLLWLYFRDIIYLYLLLTLFCGFVFATLFNIPVDKGVVNPGSAVDSIFFSSFLVFSIIFFASFSETYLVEENSFIKKNISYSIVKLASLILLLTLLISPGMGNYLLAVLLPFLIVLITVKFIKFIALIDVCARLYLFSVSVLFLISALNFSSTIFHNIHLPVNILYKTGILIAATTIQIALFFRYIRNKELQLSIFKKEAQAQASAFESQRLEIKKQSEDLKAANQELTELVELKEGLTSMIIHDLKIPLHNIINCPEKLESENQLKLIKQSGKNMLNLVMNILDVYKYEKSGIELNIEKVNAKELIQEALDQVNLLASQKNVTIYYNLPSNLFIYVDCSIIQRVFINILTNAIRHTPTNEKIHVDYIETGNDEILFQIMDTGPGIPPEKKDLVFARFGQVLAKKTGEIRSTGLGLSFCKIAIEAHQGKIGFEKNEPTGTKFWFSIPSLKQKLENIETLNHAGQISNQAVSNVKQITPELKTYLIPFIEDLKETEIYQISKIRKILKQIDSKDIDIQIWKDLIIDAVYSNNQGLFHKLLEFKE